MELIRQLYTLIKVPSETEGCIIEIKPSLCMPSNMCQYFLLLDSAFYYKSCTCLEINVFVILCYVLSNLNVHVSLCVLHVTKTHKYGGALTFF